MTLAAGLLVAGTAVAAPAATLPALHTAKLIAGLVFAALLLVIGVLYRATQRKLDNELVDARLEAAFLDLEARARRIDCEAGEPRTEPIAAGVVEREPVATSRSQRSPGPSAAAPTQRAAQR